MEKSQSAMSTSTSISPSAIPSSPPSSSLPLPSSPSPIVVTSDNFSITFETDDVLTPTIVSSASRRSSILSTTSSASSSSPLISSTPHVNSTLCDIELSSSPSSSPSVLPSSSPLDDIGFPSSSSLQISRKRSVTIIPLLSSSSTTGTHEGNNTSHSINHSSHNHSHISLSSSPLSSLSTISSSSSSSSPHLSSSSPPLPSASWDELRTIIKLDDTKETKKPILLSKISVSSTGGNNNNNGTATPSSALPSVISSSSKLPSSSSSSPTAFPSSPSSSSSLSSPSSSSISSSSHSLPSRFRYTSSSLSTLKSAALSILKSKSRGHRNKSELQLLCEWISTFNSALLRELDYNTLTALCNKIHYSHIESQQTIFCQGEKSDSFYVIVEGEVSMWINVEDRTSSFYKSEEKEKEKEKGKETEKANETSNSNTSSSTTPTSNHPPPNVHLPMSPSASPSHSVSTSPSHSPRQHHPRATHHRTPSQSAASASPSHVTGKSVHNMNIIVEEKEKEKKGNANSHHTTPLDGQINKTNNSASLPSSTNSHSQVRSPSTSAVSPAASPPSFLPSISTAASPSSTSASSSFHSPPISSPSSVSPSPPTSSSSSSSPYLLFPPSSSFPRSSLSDHDEEYVIVGNRTFYKPVGLTNVIFIGVMGAGDEKSSFGELGIVTGLPRSATIKTERESEFLVVGGEDFKEVLHEYSQQLALQTNIIKNFQGFQYANEALLQRLSLYFKPKEFPPNHTVYLQGSSCKYLFFIVEGEGMLKRREESCGQGQGEGQHGNMGKSNSNAIEVEICLVGPGEVSGEECLFPPSTLSPIPHYTHSFITKTSCLLYVIHKDPFLRRCGGKVLQTFRSEGKRKEEWRERRWRERRGEREGMKAKVERERRERREEEERRKEWEQMNFHMVGREYQRPSPSSSFPRPRTAYQLSLSTPHLTNYHLLSRYMEEKTYGIYSHDTPLSDYSSSSLYSWKTQAHHISHSTHNNNNNNNNNSGNNNGNGNKHLRALKFTLEELKNILTSEKNHHIYSQLEKEDEGRGRNDHGNENNTKGILSSESEESERHHRLVERISKGDGNMNIIIPLEEMKIKDLYAAADAMVNAKGNVNSNVIKSPPIFSRPTTASLSPTPSSSHLSSSPFSSSFSPLLMLSKVGKSLSKNPLSFHSPSIGQKKKKKSANSPIPTAFKTNPPFMSSPTSLSSPSPLLDSSFLHLRAALSGELLTSKIQYRDHYSLQGEAFTNILPQENNPKYFHSENSLSRITPSPFLPQSISSTHPYEILQNIVKDHAHSSSPSFSSSSPPAPTPLPSSSPSTHFPSVSLWNQFISPKKSNYSRRN